MFEESLLSTRVGERDAVVRLAMVAAACMQCSIAAVLWIAPLLHPERLSIAPLASSIPVPLLRKPPVMRVESEHAASGATAALPSAAATATSSPRAITQPAVVDTAPATSLAVMWSSVQGELPAGLGAGGAGPAIRVGGPGAGPAGGGTPGRVRVSSGVSSGLLLSPIRPSYPRIATAARVEGTVTVEAVISREGKVVRAHVTSGPAMLAQAALDAVRSARYRPYKLNGQPTEVETTFSIVFHLGAG